MVHTGLKYYQLCASFYHKSNNTGLCQCPLVSRVLAEAAQGSPRYQDAKREERGWAEELRARKPSPLVLRLHVAGS